MNKKHCCAATKFLLVLFQTALFSSVSIASENEYSLQDVQGAWWSSCDDPAADFVISGNSYTGDFEGTYTCSVENNKLSVDFSPNGDVVQSIIIHADSNSLELQYGLQPKKLRRCP